MTGDLTHARTLALGLLDKLRSELAPEACDMLREHLTAEVEAWCDEGTQAQDEAKPFDGVQIQEGETGYRLVPRLAAWLRHKAERAGVDLERHAILVRRWGKRDFLVFRGDDA